MNCLYKLGYHKNLLCKSYLNIRDTCVFCSDSCSLMKWYIFFQISWFTTKLSRCFKTEIALFGVDFRFNFIHWQLLSMAQTRQTLRPSKHGHNLKFCLEEAPKCWKDFLSVKTKLYSLHGSPLLWLYIEKSQKRIISNFLIIFLPKSGLA